MKEAVGEASHPLFYKRGNGVDRWGQAGDWGARARWGREWGCQERKPMTLEVPTTLSPLATSPIQAAAWANAGFVFCRVFNCSGDWYPYKAFTSSARLRSPAQPPPQAWHLNVLLSVAAKEFKFQASGQRFSPGLCSSSPLPEMLWPPTPGISSPGKPGLIVWPQHLLWCLFVVHAQGMGGWK